MFFKRKNEINFGNPLNGRKWLNLLEVDKKYGVTFKKNLSIQKEKLGFSFKSNKFGLRGNSNQDSNLVICGTSFAMGLSVDNEDNWYEKLLDYFNIGMPIGFKNFNELLKSFYKGNYQSIIYLYHPNQFPIAINYSKVYLKDKNIFDLLSWKTDYISVFRLYLKWLFRKSINKILRKEKFYDYNNIKYYYNHKYNYLDFFKNKQNILDELSEASTLFEKFDNVYIFKIPTKEEILLKYIDDPDLVNLSNNYNERWKLFKKKFKNYVIYDDLESYFSIEDYLPQDTHWSKQGNAKFYSYLRDKINV